MKFTESTRVLTREFTIYSSIPGTPIRIIVDPDGNLQDNETITITGALGDTNMNGTWVVDQISANEFDLLGSYSGGVYVPNSASFNRGTFPDWTGEANVRISNGNYKTVSKIDDYNLLLDQNHYPRQDLAGNWTITVRHYDLPADFLKMSFVTDGQQNYMSEAYVSPEEWLAHEQTGWRTSVMPFQWTILPHPTLKQRFRLLFNGVPSNDRDVSFIYQRRLNDTFRWAGVETDSSSVNDNTKTIAITNGDTTVFGNNTNFRGSMAGAILRVGVVQTPDPEEPTGLDGINPFEEEHVIASVDSVTQLTLETPITGATGTSLQFAISDLVDVAPEHMNAFYRCCEHSYNLLSRDESKLHASEASWRAAVILAMESDHKVNFYGNAMGTSFISRFADPYSTDFGDYISVGP
jgi:hypothetical protein